MEKLKDRECVLQLFGLNVFERRNQGCDLDCDNCGFYHIKRNKNNQRQKK